MRKKITAFAAAGLLLFAACGGDDDDGTATDAAADESDGGESDAADAGSGGGGGEFCDQAAAVFQPTGDVDATEPLEAAAALEPPAEIAEDWVTFIEGSQEAVEATANLDPNDPEAAAEFQEQYQDLIDASTNVYKYLGDECGMDGFTPPPTDPAQGATSTTAAG